MPSSVQGDGGAMSLMCAGLWVELVVRGVPREADATGIVSLVLLRGAVK